MADPSAPSRRTLWGIALVCFGNLLLEVLLTRIFSATVFYHFTFLAVALALFGVGAGGVYVYVRQDRFLPENANADLARNAFRFALTSVLALVYVLANPLELKGSGSEFTAQTVIQLCLLNGFVAGPFFFAGVVVSLAVVHFRGHIGRVYSYDLTAASLAAFVATVVLQWFGGPSAVLLVAVIAAVAGVLFVFPERRGWLLLVAMAAAFVVNLAWPMIRVYSVKGVREDLTVFEKWNAFSRVTVERLRPPNIKIDSDAATSLSSAAGIGRHEWRGKAYGLAYAMFDGGPETVLIIGPGGGRDVVTALDAGASRVTGVEVNDIIVRDIMKGRFAAQSGRLYTDPRVSIVVDEGRSYVRRAESRYDVIQATLVDTWAATAAGAFALTENALYTTEAFEDYFAHLTERGALTMTRWHREDGGETPRLVLLAAAALERRGVPRGRARSHLYLAASKGANAAGTLVAKRTPLLPEEVGRLDQFASANGFRVLLSPSGDGTGALEKLVDAGPWSRAVRRHRLNLTPPSDDRPFFFYFGKAEDLFRFDSLRLESKSWRGGPAAWVLLAFGACVIALAVAFMVIPLLLHRRDALFDGDRALPRRILGLAYFCAIGLAFIIVEIALMQKLGFFLGHPTYGLLVVLPAILLASGLGARLSNRIPDRGRAPASAASAGAIALLAFLYAQRLDPLLRDWVAWSSPARVATSIVISVVPGVMMGLMLPMGVRMLSWRDHAIIPWAWGLNGALSVFGTVLATVFAILHGFNATLMLGATVYLGAAGLGWFLGVSTSCDEMATAPARTGDEQAGP